MLLAHKHILIMLAVTATYSQMQGMQPAGIDNTQANVQVDSAMSSSSVHSKGCPGICVLQALSGRSCSSFPSGCRPCRLLQQQSHLPAVQSTV